KNLNLCSVALCTARLSLLIAVLSVCVAQVGGNFTPPWFVSILGPVCFAGISFAVAMYSAVLLMELSWQVRSFFAVVALTGTGLLLALFPLFGSAPKNPLYLM